MTVRLRNLLCLSAAVASLTGAALAQPVTPMTVYDYNKTQQPLCEVKPDGANLAACQVQMFQSIGLSNVGGPNASFTFGTATTAYNAGQILCSSATAATCNTAISAVWWVLPTGTIELTGGVIRITDSTATAWAANSQIQIDLFSAAPTMANGDRLAWSISSGTSLWLASLICTTAAGEQGDGVTFNCYVVGGPKSLNLGSANAKLYGTYTALTASGVTAASASLFATLTGKF